MGFHEVMCLIAQWVVVKDLSPFILEYCTSQDGSHGVIPEPPTHNITRTPSEHTGHSVVDREFIYKYIENTAKSKNNPQTSFFAIVYGRVARSGAWKMFLWIFQDFNVDILNSWHF